MGERTMKPAYWLSEAGNFTECGSGGGCVFHDAKGKPADGGPAGFPEDDATLDGFGHRMEDATHPRRCYFTSPLQCCPSLATWLL